MGESDIFIYTEIIISPIYDRKLSVKLQFYILSSTEKACTGNNTTSPKF